MNRHVVGLYFVLIFFRKQKKVLKMINASINIKLLNFIIISLIVNYRPEFYFSVGVVFILYFMLFECNNYDLSRMKFVLYVTYPILLMFFLGVVSGYYYTGINFEFLKDSFYTLKPVVMIFSGWLLIRFSRDFFGLMEAIFFVLFFHVSLYLFRFISSGGGLGSAYDSGLISLSAIIYPLVIFLMPTKNNKNKKFILFFLAVYLLAIIFSFSRAFIGSNLIILCAVLGFFVNAYRFIFVGAVFILTVFVFYFSDNGFGSAFDEVSFYGKLMNSLNEISFGVDVDDPNMLINWRGFESTQALRHINERGLVENFFGSGLGASVDIGVQVFMSSDMSFDKLPILHNGFMQILVKFGFIGLLAYLIFIYRFYLLSLNIALKNNKLFFLTGLPVVIFYLTFIVTGVFNKSKIDLILFFWGACLFMYFDFLDS